MASLSLSAERWSARMMTVPAVMLSCGSSRLSLRPISDEAHSPEVGMTCMVPMALAGETAR